MPYEEQMIQLSVLNVYLYCILITKRYGYKRRELRNKAIRRNENI